MESPVLPQVCPENVLMFNTLPSDRSSSKTETYEKLGKKSLSDWLKANGHWEDSTKLDECSLSVEHWTCDSGHDFYFRKYCGREYCPICGAKNSYYHNRRTMRAGEHFIWAVTWGNLTFTMPKDISAMRLDKSRLRKLQKLAWEVSRDVFGLEGAGVTVHLLGREGEGLHVHFEVLFHMIGCFNRGKVEPEKIGKVKEKWAEKLNEEFGLKLETTSVRYSFAATHPRKWHKLNYIHRPICTEEAMLTLDDLDKEYILSLKGYHRTRWFGVMANSKLHAFLRKHWAPITLRETPLIEKRICPMCKTKLHYMDRMFISEIPESQVVQYNQDIWMDKAVDAFMHAPPEEQLEILKAREKIQPPRRTPALSCADEIINQYQLQMKGLL